MTAVINKALDFIDGMNTAVSEPQPMDESTIKGMLKYLKDLGVPANMTDITLRGDQEGWNSDFTSKIAEWAGRVDSNEHIVIKNPEYFSLYMQEQLKALV